MIRRVVCVAAAGPRRGFGHLVRCGVVVRTLGAGREVVLRSSPRTAATARRLGWRVLRPAAAFSADSLPDLVVIDDPSARHAARWVRRANRLGIPVAAIHDLGLGRVPADLSIDGSPVLANRSRPADLQGPAFAILDPDIVELRGAQRPRGRVLVALGGGARGRRFAVRVARALVRQSGTVTVDLVAGFAPPRRLASLPSRCRWVRAPHGLAMRLSSTTVAVIAGGVTLYEACALGTPAVAVPIVPAQRLTIDAFARARAVVSPVAHLGHSAPDRVAFAVLDLLGDTVRSRAFGRQAARLVDGHGARRVARSLMSLVRRARRETVRARLDVGPRGLMEVRRAA